MNGNFDLLEFLPYLLNRAAEETSLSFSKIYGERYGMLRTEWRVLVHLGQFGGMTASQIVERAGLHKTKVSRAISALESRRFVERASIESDRRSTIVVLTGDGRRVHGELCEIAWRYNVKITSDFSDEELVCLQDYLRRLSGL